MDDLWIGSEPAAVEAHLRADGTVQPIAFTWRGRHWTVSGLGRQWDDDDGRHVLVITTDESRFELCLSSKSSGWVLLRAWVRPHLA